MGSTYVSPNRVAEYESRADGFGKSSGHVRDSVSRSYVRVDWNGFRTGWTLNRNTVLKQESAKQTDRLSAHAETKKRVFVDILLQIAAAVPHRVYVVDQVYREWTCALAVLLTH